MLLFGDFDLLLSVFFLQTSVGLLDAANVLIFLLEGAFEFGYFLLQDLALLSPLGNLRVSEFAPKAFVLLDVALTQDDFLFEVLFLLKSSIYLLKKLGLVALQSANFGLQLIILTIGCAQLFLELCHLRHQLLLLFLEFINNLLLTLHLLEVFLCFFLDYF